MQNRSMTSLERVLTTLSHQEPDRVPLFLLVTMHGAKELGLSIKDYFAKAEHVAEGQLRLRKKYPHDCLYNFFYAAVELEAWQGETIFREDGPPNAGEPIIKQWEDILKLTPPKIKTCRCLEKVLRSAELLKSSAGNEVPIIGVVMSPFSLPVMQMGFDNYLELIMARPDLFERLMQVNEEFCVAWANAQLAAGSTAICYFDPLSSSSMVPRNLFLKTGYEIARRVLGRLNGPAAIHLASGRCLPIAADLATAGAAVLGVSADEDLSALKRACAGKVSLLGNLNGIEMRRWTAAQAEATVKDCLAKAGQGGGFILADNHGEIPWQVPDEILMALAEATRRWGQYPLKWLAS